MEKGKAKIKDSTHSAHKGKGGEKGKGGMPKNSGKHPDLKKGVSKAKAGSKKTSSKDSMKLKAGRPQKGNPAKIAWKPFGI